MAEGPATDEDGSDPVDALRRKIESRPSLPPSSPGPESPALGPPTPTVDAEGSQPREPAVEIVVTPARIFVTLDLPGASEDRIDVRATERTLEIRAAGPDSREYTRRLDLPRPVNPDAVQATYTNGVLDITLLRRQAHIVRVRRGERDD
jgi:HSP20 family molecular chaperone IbpA